MDPETIKTFINLGAIGIVLFLIINGTLVPRAYYDREVKRGDTATTAAESNAAALKDLTEETKLKREEQTRTLADVKQSLADVTELIRAIRAGEQK